MGQTLNKIRGEEKRVERAVESAGVRSPKTAPSLSARKEERDGARKKAKECAKALKRSSFAAAGSRPDRAAEKRARKEAAYKKALAAEEEQKKQNENDRIRERKWARERAKAKREREEARKRAEARAKAKHEKAQRKAAAKRDCAGW